MGEQDATLQEIIEQMEAMPTSSDPTLSVLTGSDTTAHREQLAIVISTGKSKEELGKQITHDELKRLSDKDVEMYYKRYEAYVGTKSTESMIDSFLMLASKAAGLVVKIDDVNKLEEELKNNYIINREMSALAGNVALRCGRLFALANAALITVKHIDFKTADPVATTTTTVHPSRDSEGYPLEGVDECGH